MSTARFNTLQNAAGSKSVPVDTVVDGSAKAWVNFNGTGTVAIRAAFNVTSITDNGSGDYTVNFTTAMADANYAVLATGGDSAANYNVIHTSSTTAPTAAAVRIQSVTQNSGNPVVFDITRASVAIFD